jgi:hypothetical protein
MTEATSEAQATGAFSTALQQAFFACAVNRFFNKLLGVL